MKWSLVRSLLFAAALGPASVLNAADPPSFLEGNEHLAAGRHAKAVAAYEKVGGPQTSAALENNRGLALLGVGKTGGAVAHLRNAEALAPRDAEIQANLALARSRVAPESREPAARSAGTRLRLNELGAVTLASAWIWFGLFAFVRIRPAAASALKGLPLAAGLASLCLAAALAATVIHRRGLAHVVALDPGADIQLSPFSEARKVFTAAAGQELRLRDQQNGWLMVEDPATARYGWVKATAVSVTPIW